jgi:phosphatidylinositol alpha-mannosyltransferase
MKVGIVSSYFYPWYGGITEHVYHQYKELKARGHEVKLITPFDGSGVLQDCRDLIRIGRPVPLLLNGSVVKVPVLTRGKEIVNRILADEQFDVVHLHQPLFCVLGLTFLRCIINLRNENRPIPAVVGTFHACGGGSERFLVHRLGFFFRRFADCFDYRIAVSAASKDFIQPVLPGPFAVIPNGVDIARFSTVKEKIGRFDDGVMNILFVGRLEPRKGLTRLLKSIPYIQNHTAKKFRLLVVGNGVLTPYYKSRVPSEAIDKVIFTGEVSVDELPRYYNTAHLFCSPATYGESFGIVLVEAMAAGLPVVAGNNEGYSRIVRQNVNGFLVNSESPQEIAVNIANLLESEDLRRRFSERNRFEAWKYSWNSIVDKIEKIYSGITGQISPEKCYDRQTG